jgi:excisionase family DNA binding protein
MNRPETKIQKAVDTGTVGPAFATVVEAAKYLHVSRAKLYTMMDAQEIAYAKFGNCRRIPWAELRAYAERCTVRAC